MSWGAGRNRSMRGEEIITKNKKLVEEQFPRKREKKKPRYVTAPY
jgi:hypothetical protein